MTDNETGDDVRDVASATRDTERGNQLCGFWLPGSLATTGPCEKPEGHDEGIHDGGFTRVRIIPDIDREEAL